MILYWKYFYRLILHEREKHEKMPTTQMRRALAGRDSPSHAASFSWLVIAPIDRSTDTSDTLVGDILPSPSAEAGRVATAARFVIVKECEKMYVMSGVTMTS
jgi:hypothetical protein